MKKFLVGVAQIVVALVIAGAIYVLAGWAVSAWRDRGEDAGNVELAAPKTWQPLMVGALENATFSLDTAWRAGSMYYRFRMTGLPRWFAADRANQGAGAGPKVSLIFLDEHGFKVFEHDIPLADMTHVVDNAGHVTGPTARSQVPMAADLYRRIAAEVNWSR